MSTTVEVLLSLLSIGIATFFLYAIIALFLLGFRQSHLLVQRVVLILLLCGTVFLLRPLLLFGIAYSIDWLFASLGYSPDEQLGRLSAAVVVTAYLALWHFSLRFAWRKLKARTRKQP